MTQDGSTGENPVNVDNSGIPASDITDQIDTSNLDTQDSENEKKALAGGWTSGSRPIVSGATPIEVEVTDAGYGRKCVRSFGRCHISSCSRE